MNVVHKFETMSTGRVYDESQCNDDIKDGDILVAEGGSVAILVEAWPTWVKGPVGHFHTWDSTVTWMTVDGGKYAEAYRTALAV